jgi:hypothetical protein
MRVGPRGRRPQEGASLRKVRVGARAGRTTRTARRAGNVAARACVLASNDADYPCLIEYISKFLN